MTEAQHRETGSDYSRGCRCDVCRAINTARAAKLRQHYRDQRVLVDGRWTAPVPAELHGRWSTYSNRGCRCEPCSTTHTIFGNRSRERRKLAKITSQQEQQ